MGILNVTPDSFSDGGRFTALGEAVSQAERMVEEGASIIDVGGESTGPKSAPISAAEEQARALPVIKALAVWGKTLISVDTYREETARLAVEAGTVVKPTHYWRAIYDPPARRAPISASPRPCART